MTKTIIALYDDFPTAQHVVENLAEAGFSRNDISVMANDASGNYARSTERGDMVVEDDVTAGEGAGFGAVVGGLVGLGAALIPGIGPVIGAGPLAVALTAGIGAAAGAITGGITAGLIDMGVDEDDANIYAEGVRRGGTLVSLTTQDEWAERAQDIMNRHNPVDIDTRSSLWRERGWAGFDANAEPYNAEQVEQERLAYRDYPVEHGMGTEPEQGDYFSDRERRESIQPTGRVQSPSDYDQEMARTADAVTDYDNTSGGHRAAEEATRNQNMDVDATAGVNTGAPSEEDRGTIYGALQNAVSGATGDFEDDTPPGAERHHEASRGVRQAMERDTSGSAHDDRTEKRDFGTQTGGTSEQQPYGTTSGSTAGYSAGTGYGTQEGMSAGINMGRQGSTSGTMPGGSMDASVASDSLTRDSSAHEAHFAQDAVRDRQLSSAYGGRSRTGRARVYESSRRDSDTNP